MNGGYWEYYELSNGGFFMAPTRPEKLKPITPNIELLMAKLPTTQNSRISGISTPAGMRRICLAWFHS